MNMKLLRLGVLCIMLGGSAFASADNTIPIPQGSVLGYRYGIGGGMGLHSINVTDVVRYINGNYVVDPESRLSEFSTAVEFFGAFDLFMFRGLALGFEYSYMLSSHNIPSGFGSSDFTLTLHSPLLLGHYIVEGSNFFFKFGGGIGYTFVRFREELAQLPDPEIYSGGGLGGKLSAIGHTPFGDHLFGYIGIEMRFGFPGTVKNDEGMYLNDGIDDVSLTYLSFGLKFGLMYYF
jgi:hypothetical protein